MQHQAERSAGLGRDEDAFHAIARAAIRPPNGLLVRLLLCDSADKPRAKLRTAIVIRMRSPRQQYLRTNLGCVARYPIRNPAKCGAFPRQNGQPFFGPPLI